MNTRGRGGQSHRGSYQGRRTVQERLQGIVDTGDSDHGNLSASEHPMDQSDALHQETNPRASNHPSRESSREKRSSSRDKKERSSSRPLSKDRSDTQKSRSYIDDQVNKKRNYTKEITRDSSQRKRSASGLTGTPRKKVRRESGPEDKDKSKSRSSGHERRSSQNKPKPCDNEQKSKSQNKLAADKTKAKYDKQRKKDIQRKTKVDSRISGDKTPKKRERRTDTAVKDRKSALSLSSYSHKDGLELRGVDIRESRKPSSPREHTFCDRYSHPSRERDKGRSSNYRPTLSEREVSEYRSSGGERSKSKSPRAVQGKGSSRIREREPLKTIKRRRSSGKAARRISSGKKAIKSLRHSETKKGSKDVEKEHRQIDEAKNKKYDDNPSKYVASEEIDFKSEMNITKKDSKDDNLHADHHNPITDKLSDQLIKETPILDSDIESKVKETVKDGSGGDATTEEETPSLDLSSLTSDNKGKVEKVFSHKPVDEENHDFTKDHQGKILAKESQAAAQKPLKLVPSHLRAVSTEHSNQSHGPLTYGSVNDTLLVCGQRFCETSTDTYDSLSNEKDSEARGAPVLDFSSARSAITHSNSSSSDGNGPEVKEVLAENHPKDSVKKDLFLVPGPEVRPVITSPRKPSKPRRIVPIHLGPISPKVPKRTKKSKDVAPSSSSEQVNFTPVGAINKNASPEKSTPEASREKTSDKTKSELSKELASDGILKETPGGSEDYVKTETIVEGDLKFNQGEKENEINCDTLNLSVHHSHEQSMGFDVGPSVDHSATGDPDDQDVVCIKSRPFSSSSTTTITTTTTEECDVEADISTIETPLQDRSPVEEVVNSEQIQTKEIEHSKQNSLASLETNNEREQGTEIKVEDDDKVQAEEQSCDGNMDAMKDIEDLEEGELSSSDLEVESESKGAATINTDNFDLRGKLQEKKAKRESQSLNKERNQGGFLGSSSHNQRTNKEQQSKDTTRSSRDSRTRGLGSKGSAAQDPASRPRSRRRSKDLSPGRLHKSHKPSVHEKGDLEYTECGERHSSSTSSSKHKRDLERTKKGPLRRPFSREHQTSDIANTGASDKEDMLDRRVPSKSLERSKRSSSGSMESGRQSHDEQNTDRLVERRRTSDRTPDREYAQTRVYERLHTSDRSPGLEYDRSRPHERHRTMCRSPSQNSDEHRDKERKQGGRREHSGTIHEEKKMMDRNSRQENESERLQHRSSNSRSQGRDNEPNRQSVRKAASSRSPARKYEHDRVRGCSSRSPGRNSEHGRNQERKATCIQSPDRRHESELVEERERKSDRGRERRLLSSRRLGRDNDHQERRLPSSRSPERGMDRLRSPERRLPSSRGPGRNSDQERMASSRSPNRDNDRVGSRERRMASSRSPNRDNAHVGSRERKTTSSRSPGRDNDFVGSQERRMTSSRSPNRDNARVGSRERRVASSRSPGIDLDRVGSQERRMASSRSPNRDNARVGSRERRVASSRSPGRDNYQVRTKERRNASSRSPTRGSGMTSTGRRVTSSRNLDKDHECFGSQEGSVTSGRSQDEEDDRVGTQERKDTSSRSSGRSQERQSTSDRSSIQGNDCIRTRENRNTFQISPSEDYECDRTKQRRSATRRSPHSVDEYGRNSRHEQAPERRDSSNRAATPELDNFSESGPTSRSSLLAEEGKGMGKASIQNFSPKSPAFSSDDEGEESPSHALFGEDGEHCERRDSVGHKDVPERPKTGTQQKLTTLSASASESQKQDCVERESTSERDAEAHALANVPPKASKGIGSQHEIDTLKTLDHEKSSNSMVKGSSSKPLGNSGEVQHSKTSVEDESDSDADNINPYSIAKAKAAMFMMESNMSELSTSSDDCSDYPTACNSLNSRQPNKPDNASNKCDDKKSAFRTNNCFMDYDLEETDLVIDLEGTRDSARSKDFSERSEDEQVKVKANAVTEMDCAFSQTRKFDSENKGETPVSGDDVKSCKQGSSKTTVITSANYKSKGEQKNTKRHSSSTSSSSSRDKREKKSYAAKNTTSTNSNNPVKTQEKDNSDRSSDKLRKNTENSSHISAKDKKHSTTSTSSSKKPNSKAVTTSGTSSKTTDSKTLTISSPTPTESLQNSVEKSVSVKQNKESAASGKPKVSSTSGKGSRKDHKRTSSSQGKKESESEASISGKNKEKTHSDNSGVKKKHNSAAIKKSKHVSSNKEMKRVSGENLDKDSLGQENEESSNVDVDAHNVGKDGSKSEGKNTKEHKVKPSCQVANPRGHKTKHSLTSSSAAPAKLKEKTKSRESSKTERKTSGSHTSKIEGTLKDTSEEKTKISSGGNGIEAKPEGANDIVYGSNCGDIEKNDQIMDRKQSTSSSTSSSSSQVRKKSRDEEKKKSSSSGSTKVSRSEGGGSKESNQSVKEKKEASSTSKTTEATPNKSSTGSGSIADLASKLEKGANPSRDNDRQHKKRRASSSHEGAKRQKTSTGTSDHDNKSKCGETVKKVVNTPESAGTGKPDCVSETVVGGRDVSTSSKEKRKGNKSSSSSSSREKGREKESSKSLKSLKSTESKGVGLDKGRKSSDSNKEAGKTLPEFTEL